MARNAHQLLGNSLKSPSLFILCWTDGGRVTGGTGQALRMAPDLGIPVINLGSCSLEYAEATILDINERTRL